MIIRRDDQSGRRCRLIGRLVSLLVLCAVILTACSATPESSAGASAGSILRLRSIVWGIK